MLSCLGYPAADTAHPTVAARQRVVVVRLLALRGALAPCVFDQRVIGRRKRQFSVCPVIGIQRRPAVVAPNHVQRVPDHRHLLHRQFGCRCFQGCWVHMLLV